MALGARLNGLLHKRPWHLPVDASIFRGRHTDRLWPTSAFMNRHRLFLRATAALKPIPPCRSFMPWQCRIAPIL